MGLARIMVSLGLDATGFQTGLKRAESVGTRFGRSFAGSMKGYLATAFGIGAITAATHRLVAWADKLQDTSDDLRISTTVLQEWEQATVGTRASLDDMIRAFQFLSRQNPTMGPGKVTEEFNKLAEGFKNGSVSLGELQQKLGRGASLLAGPFMRGLRGQGMNIVSESDVKTLADMSDAIERLAVNLRGPFASAVAFAANSMAKMVDEIKSVSAFYGAGTSGAGYSPKRFQDWIRSGFVNPTSIWSMLGHAAKSPNLGFNLTAAAEAYAATKTKPPMIPGVPEFAGTEPPTQTEYSGRWSIGSANALQQVGAFIGSQPQYLVEAKEHTKLLKKIADETEKTAEAVG